MNVELRNWTSASKIPDNKTMVRLIKNTKVFFNPPEVTKPHPDAFVINDADINEGQVSGMQPLLSVWNKDEIALENAKRNRNTNEPLLGYCLEVEKIHKIETEGPVPVEAHYSPDERQGIICGNAHCGIQGVYPIPDVPDKKRIYRAIRSQLVDICYKHPEEK